MNQEIRCVSPDNRAMCTKCCKQVSSEPALDLLPRVRYMIDLSEPIIPFTPSAKLLFDLGLHLVPVKDTGDDMVYKIVAINLSDKIIRIENGMSLCDGAPDYVHASSPVHSVSERDTGGSSDDTPESRLDLEMACDVSLGGPASCSA